MDEADEPQGLPEGETVSENEIVAPEATEEEQVEQPEAPKVPKGWQSRIDQLTRQKYEEQRARETLEAELKQLREKVGKTPQDDIETLAEARAQQILDQRRRKEEADQLNARFGEWDARGVEKVPGFHQKCATVAALGANDRPEFMQTILDMDDGEMVIASLADDPDKVQHILTLPAHKMALELAKLSGKAPAPKKVSSAPAPIKPVDGSARAKSDPNEWSVEDHIKYRQERQSR